MHRASVCVPQLGIAFCPNSFSAECLISVISFLFLSPNRLFLKDGDGGGRVEDKEGYISSVSRSKCIVSLLAVHRFRYSLSMHFQLPPPPFIYPSTPQQQHPSQGLPAPCALPQPCTHPPSSVSVSNFSVSRLTAEGTTPFLAGSMVTGNY